MSLRWELKHVRPTPQGENLAASSSHPFGARSATSLPHCLCGAACQKYFQKVHINVRCLIALASSHRSFHPRRSWMFAGVKAPQGHVAGWDCGSFSCLCHLCRAGVRGATGRRRRDLQPRLKAEGLVQSITAWFRVMLLPGVGLEQVFFSLCVLGVSTCGCSCRSPPPAQRALHGWIWW